jgi:hypothetical protein
MFGQKVSQAIEKRSEHPRRRYYGERFVPIGLAQIRLETLCLLQRALRDA